jgi:DNA polymerase III alpha subunit
VDPQAQAYFGDDLFVEIMPHDIDDQRTANIEAISMAQRSTASRSW